jgi:tRNA(Ile)-lysidine synthase
MNLLKSFQKYIRKEELFQKNDFLLLAVSGGVDSVVLCELCSQSGFHFAIAHCNFQLRGEASIRDENFVKQLAQKYNVEIFTRTFDTTVIAQQQKKSIEEAARDLRYDWFYELIEARGQGGNSKMKQVVGGQLSEFSYPKFILTAHHADDNIETVLMNFFRGTGIKGLRGILPKQQKIIRPLLFASKNDIENFASENQLAYVQDHTNAENDYTRNYFRNELIPSIKKVFPNVEENIINNIDRFRDVDQLYQQSISDIKKKLLEKKGNEIHIPVLKLAKYKPLHSITYEIIKDFGFTSMQTNDIIALMHSDSGKYVQSGNYRVIRNRKWLIISPNKTAESQHIIINADDTLIEFGSKKLSVKRNLTGQYTLSAESNMCFVDLDQIRFPLLLRKWKTGDYFYPLGMNKKKKLSRFFIDQKLSLTEKENCWVIETDKKIVWVVGMRIDDRFKIKTSTKNVLQITCTSR